MKNIFFFFLLLTFISCESEAERLQREADEEQQRIELVEQQKQQEREAEEERLRIAEQQRKREAEAAIRAEAERVEREAVLEKERQEKAIYDRYINNSLRTGATPYSYCFGKNRSCPNYGCSEIEVKTPSNSDVMVTIKKNDRVYRHAYINAGSRHKFEFPNGTYQAFFYYGKGWNPKKIMKQTDCGPLKGGFITSEHFGKDNPQLLNNSILKYELILQQNGNFSTKPSNSEEAF